MSALNAAANLAIHSSVFKEKIFSEGGIVVGGDSKTFTTSVANDYVKWIRSLRVQAQRLINFFCL